MATCTRADDLPEPALLDDALLLTPDASRPLREGDAVRPLLDAAWQRRLRRKLHAAPATPLERGEARLSRAGLRCGVRGLEDHSAGKHASAAASARAASV